MNITSLNFKPLSNNDSLTKLIDVNTFVNDNDNDNYNNHNFIASETKNR